MALDKMTLGKSPRIMVCSSGMPFEPIKKAFIDNTRHDLFKKAERRCGKWWLECFTINFIQVSDQYAMGEFVVKNLETHRYYLGSWWYVFTEGEDNEVELDDDYVVPCAKPTWKSDSPVIFLENLIQ